MATISDRTPPVSVEYDSRGKRATKTFDDANVAKRFYAAKLKDGKNPAVHADNAGLAQATQTDAEADPASELSDAVNAAATANPGPPTLRVPGVSANAKTRAYYAGVIVRRHGHDAGVTPAMIAELDVAYGKANAVESEICLRNAWHCVRGYTEAAQA